MKILYITTISDTMGFFISCINMLLDKGHKVDMGCSIVKPINQELIDRGCNVFDIEFQRSPFRKDNYTAYKKLKALIIKEKYDLIHTHTPVASAIVRLACKNNKDVKVIYTAHGFHFYKGSSIKNWLIYFPVEYWLSRYTDVLITINKEDYNRASNKFKAKKIYLIHGVGINISKFSDLEVDENEVRRLIDVKSDEFMIISVGELNSNKNHQIIIKALAKLKNNKIKYIICGQGMLDDYLKKLSYELGVADQVKFLGFRSDIPELMRASDLFVFPSYREGLSVALMEAMASGLPVICSNIRGNNDLIEDGKGGYLVEPNNTTKFSDRISKLYNNINIREEFASHNKNVIKEYSLDSILKEMIKIY